MHQHALRKYPVEYELVLIAGLIAVLAGLTGLFTHEGAI